MSEALALGELREKFSAWLGGPEFRWTSFGTYSFDHLKGRTTVHCFDHILEWIGKIGSAGSHRCFVCHELGAVNDRPHLHALTEHPGIMYSEVKGRWQKKYGWAKVKPYNSQLGAEHYVTKYILKDACNIGDWAIKSTCGFEADPDLFEAPLRVTGYRLYTDYMRTLREKNGR